MSSVIIVPFLLLLRTLGHKEDSEIILPKEVATPEPN